LGDKTARETAIKAADKLITRYHEKAKILQAWGDLSDPEQRGRMIIDCNMNLPLLYFASKETSDRKYYDIAVNHAEQAAKYIVREDSSTYHTFYMDTETGEPLYGKTAQGYSDKSCWARGQAWGVYGFVLSYVHTGDRKFLDISEKLANYFLNRLPEDDICYWDLDFTEGNEERDSSAASIMACGLLELSKHLPVSNEYRELYENAAVKMIKSLAENYTTKNVNSNGILLHAVYSKPGGNGVDECCIWGDYYYLEALIRTEMSWRMYW
jgi:unsaturated chondroitin disaccharide hydrolase